MIPYYGLQAPRKGGHYESWFVRANHPHKPQAIWIRYTLFRARDRRPALGEVWAVWSDGDRQCTHTFKEEFPLTQCHFGTDQMQVNAGDNRLAPGRLQGSLSRDGEQLAWDLHYDGGEAPLLLLPESFYEKPLPKAKSLVSRPHIHLSGTLTLNGDTLELDQWPGSENHNWGSQHTDRYAWGQVVGFDNAPQAFLECATAQIKVGPVYSPQLSIAVLRLDGDTFRFNRLSQALRASARYHPFQWQLQTGSGDTQLKLAMTTVAERVAALTYYNPPGGNKICLNSKLAGVTATLSRRGQPERVLHSTHGGAFEILTDSLPAGMTLQV